MLMKKVLFLIVFLSFGFYLSADRDEVVLNPGGNQHNHNEYYPPADMPEVYIDTDNQEIIIVGDGFSAYYDVDIISQSSMIAVISTQVDGYGDSIDVSSLPDDNYTIVITSEFNNVYQGQFTNY